MKYLSVCSGIEAATVAWRPLGWRAAGFSEIEPFPSAVLAHHHPAVPNLGDMTNFREWPEEVFAQADMIVGGPPCQAFSVAGKRQGLNDDRGNLTLIYTELIEHADTIRLKHGKPPVIVIYENVPGILSDKTNAFGCLLGALAGEDCELQPSGKRWTNAGYVLGPERAVAWRVLDAQYFGLAQRRKRVFVVASARDGFCPAEVLFEFDGVRRDIAPSREAGQEVAGNVGAGANQTGFRKLTFESYAQDETASTMMARDYKSYTDLVAYGIPGNWVGRKPENGGNSTQTATDKHGVICIEGQHPNAAIGEEIAPTLTEAMGAGGGHIPIINNVVAFNSRQDPVSGDVFGTLDTSSPQAQAIAIQGSVIGRKQENGPQGSGHDDTGVCFTQTSVDRHAVATVYPINTMTMLGRPSDDLKPRMGLGIGKENDPQNTLSAAHCHAVAITQVAGTLTTGFGSRGVDMCQIANGNCAISQTAVRRLTPKEAERLMGFPDGYTVIPWRGKPVEECPDGHRYKALGNSMAVPCMAWLGQRIQAAL